MSSRYSSAAHQRDLRTQLFAPPQAGGKQNVPPVRASSPYEPASSNSAKYDQSYLSSLESQNEQELDSMSSKVKLLKNLGVRMGDEINKSINLNNDISNSMERGKITLKSTWNNMIVMSQRAGITWRMWLVVFALVALWWFYVWLF